MGKSVGFLFYFYALIVMGLKSKCNYFNVEKSQTNNIFIKKRHRRVIALLEIK